MNVYGSIFIVIIIILIYKIYSAQKKYNNKAQNENINSFKKSISKVDNKSGELENK